MNGIIAGVLCVTIICITIFSCTYINLKHEERMYSAKNISCTLNDELQDIRHYIRDIGTLINLICDKLEITSEKCGNQDSL